jgi:hypothetical protein
VFPTPYLVIAPAVPYLAFGLDLVAERIPGVRMTVHGSNAVGFVVEFILIIAILSALLVEALALLRATFLLWKRPDMRTKLNAVSVGFGLVAVVPFLVVATS